MANNKDIPYLTSPDKSFIASSLSDEQIAAQKIAKAYRQHKRKTSDDVAFNSMQKATPELSVMEADKTRADLSGYKADKSTADVHKALMAAGMTPAYGNVADLADATLYALEGEFGDAAWSAASAIPIIGQMVAGKRALKIAKESGEKMVTLYRGVNKVDDINEMVYKGKFISPKNLFNKPWDEKFFKDMTLKAKRDFIDYWTKKQGRVWGGQPSKVGTWASENIEEAMMQTGKGTVGGKLLQFEVPAKWLKENTHKVETNWIIGGVPTEFLKKVTDIK